MTFAAPLCCLVLLQIKVEKWLPMSAVVAYEVFRAAAISVFEPNPPPLFLKITEDRPVGISVQKTLENHKNLTASIRTAQYAYFVFFFFRFLLWLEYTEQKLLFLRQRNSERTTHDRFFQSRIC